MKHRLIFLLGIACAIVSPVFAQNGFESVYPNLFGDELIDSLASHYRPAVVLDYAKSRDTLYAKVLGIDDDSIRCIYSGHTLYLDPTKDPTQYIYLGGSTSGMNTEHAYPQSKGALDGNARSDMHHLFPARIPVNEARGDKPFLDIPDNQTDKWFLNNQSFSTKPTSNIDAYAESNETAFEPREKSKGDLARAVFYFYTVYRGQANAADPNYFGIMRLTLCQWNEKDPADSAELVKTWRIAPYQEGKPNPFVLDCTLAARSWCPEVPPACATGVHQARQNWPLQMEINPNPVENDRLVCKLNLPFSGNLNCRLVNMQGQTLVSNQITGVPSGPYQIQTLLPASFLSTHNQGIWIVTLQNGEKQALESKMIVAF